MSAHELAPAQALRRCLDNLLSDIQTLIVLPVALPMTAAYDLLPTLLSRLEATSRFLNDGHSAELCLALCHDWRAAQTKSSVGCDRQFLTSLLQCRESLQPVTAGESLQQVLADSVRAAIDNMTVAAAGPASEWQPEPGRVQETGRRCVAIAQVARFMDAGRPGRLQPPPQTPRAMLRWLLLLEQRLLPDMTEAGVPTMFRRELERCVQHCRSSAADDALSQSLWQLQLLAGALLGLESRLEHGAARRLWRHRCQGLLASAAQTLHQRRSADQVDHDVLRQVIRHAWRLSAAHGWQRGGDNIGPPLSAALVALPDTALSPVQEVLGIIAHGASVPMDWASMGLRLYRLLVCLRMLDGGFVDNAGRQCPDLRAWQTLIASLYTSVNHCVQQSVVTSDDKVVLTALLRRLQRPLQADTDTDAADLLPAVWLLAARLELRAHQHWQRLTLELDAAQQDFAGGPVHQVLAAELHCLPGLGRIRGDAGAAAGEGPLPRTVLRDLRVLLKGARILNVQRIESLVVVMIEVYQQILRSPAFADTTDIGKVLPRAHRSLSRMLDQAAAWQAPGNARRVINSLYVCLEQWRGDSNADNVATFAAVNERPAGHDNDTWRLCLATNRRLRQLLRHQDDLDSIRALLLELLRSQEEFIRRQADYGAALDAPQV